jgi:hypothetical protein
MGALDSHPGCSTKLVKVIEVSAFFRAVPASARQYPSRSVRA